MVEQSPEPESGANALRESAPIAVHSGTSILEVILVLANRKWLILVVTLLVTGAAAARVHFMPNSFKAQAVILPPQQQQSSLAALASGALGSLAGAVKTPGDLYIGMLKSRAVMGGVVARFHLQDVYQQKFSSDAQRTLARHAFFVTGKDSLIAISVEDHDPKRAAALANGFVDGLYDLTSRLALTGASQRRLFFEQELRKERDNLSDAEVGLTKVQRATGLLLPAGQESVLIGSTARLHADIAGREVALQAAEAYATEENPQIQILQREIAAMRAQLKYLETKDGTGSSFEITAAKLPEAALGYTRQVRDLKYHETLYELLAKQYEAARLDESRQAPLIQVIDRATVPDRRSGPPRRLIVLCAGLLSFILSSLYVYIGRTVKTFCSDPEHARSLATFRSALWSRR